MYETSDFYLACFLRCMGYHLADLKRAGGRSLFVFRDRPERRTAVMSFYSDQAQVRPLAFVGIIRDMKALIHNA